MAAQNVSATKVEVDPRVERSREQVLRSTLDLLAEVGFGDLTIEGVAARSGVAKSTIYRHWKGKLELVTDAFVELRTFDAPPAPGPVRERVTALLTEVADSVIDPSWRVTCLPALFEASARCPEVAEVSRDLAETGMSRLLSVLDEGVAAGELPAGTDTSLLADALVGPIFLRSMFHRPPVRPEEVPGLVALLLPP